MGESVFEKLRKGLSRTRSGMLEAIFAGSERIDEDFYDELEEALIVADVGVDIAGQLIESLREKVRSDRLKTVPEARDALKGLIAAAMTVPNAAAPAEQVILLVGVNGVGKTTCAGKLAKRYASAGRTVILAAGDTFRAAAGEQLGIWAERTGSTLIRHNDGADPAAVLFDAISAYKSRKGDVLICDTAGRLHNNKNLMGELAKMRRVIARELPEAECSVLLVLDAATGQNALYQAEVFSREAGATGVILTKLDGTAKGGMAIAVKQKLGLPICFIGVGEGVDDLQPFDPSAFAEAFV